MRYTIGVLVFCVIMLLLDIYVYRAVQTVVQNSSPKAKAIIYAVYWVISILAISGFLLFVYTSPEVLGKQLRTYLFALIIGLFLAKMVVLFFLLIDDARRFLQWISTKFFQKRNEHYQVIEHGVTRSVFLSWMGLAAGASLFGGLLAGFRNKYNYQLSKIRLSFKNLPEGFKGLRVVHISDIHSGSLLNTKEVQRGVALINSMEPDVILFTGDLVNDRAAEMNELLSVFNQLKAPLGVYSILGNHDYGDYVRWPHKGLTKKQNLENLKQVHAKLGWRLLMNEHVSLNRNGSSIALIGVENWSAKGNFPKYGNLEQATKGAEVYPFSILMSHDPSHWDAEVLKKHNNIDLTLSGHTHGMQFGVELPGFRWSPVQYVYKQWAGLYEKEHQRLYVNRGFGFIGYPGRVGILPEITVIELV